MAIIYVSDGPWGTGTGVPHTAATGDNNFYELDQRVQELEDNPPVAAGISNIQVNGSQMMIFLSNGDSYGPFTLPVAAINFAGEFVAGQQYYELDVITVLGQGMFFVKQDHVGVDPFDPDRIEGGEPVYQLLFGSDPSVYHFGLFIPGSPGLGIPASRNMYAHVFAADVYIGAGMTGSIGHLYVAATDDDLVFSICKDDVEIGTMTFPQGEFEAVFDFPSDVQFSAHNVFSVIRPTALDSTANELVCTFVGTRGTLPDEPT